MSQVAEMIILQRQVDELKNDLKIVERGLSNKQLKLRDQFAMSALQALIPIYEQDPSFDLCFRAYQIADSMLQARDTQYDQQ